MTNSTAVSVSSNYWLQSAIALLLVSMAGVFPVTFLVWLLVLLAMVVIVTIKQKIAFLPTIKWVVLIVSVVLAIVFDWFGVNVHQFVQLASLAIVLKLYELTSKKTALHFVLVGLFVNATVLLLEQGIGQMLLQLLVMLLLLCCLLQLSLQSFQHINNTYIIKYVSTQLLLCIPFMLLLFLVFPRLSSFWAMPELSNRGAVGLSDVVNPGSFAQLSQSDELVFSVQFFDSKGRNISQEKTQDQLYWRALTLDQFDGRQWQKTQKDPIAVPVGQSVLEASTYNVTLQPSYNRWLFTLDSPVRPVSSSVLLEDGTVLANEKTQQVLRYAVVSTSNALAQQIPSTSYLQQLRQLPQLSNPKTWQLSQQLWQHSGNKQAYLDSILNYFNQQSFYYSLSPPLLRSEQQIDEFLFESKTGFCGHYASAFLVLARMQGIASRMVGGYLGADYNAEGDFWQIRQASAHAWVEVFIDGRWQRIDPTTVIAPGRIEQGIYGLAEYSPASLIAQIRSWPVLQGLYSQIAAINFLWQQQVINYSESSRVQFLQNVQRYLRSSWLPILSTMLTLVAAIYLGLWCKRIGVAWRRPVAVKIKQQLRAYLIKQHCVFSASDSVEDYLQCIMEHNNKCAVQCQQFLLNYQQCLYQPSVLMSDKELMKQFKRLKKQLG